MRGPNTVGRSTSGQMEMALAEVAFSGKGWPSGVE